MAKTIKITLGEDEYEIPRLNIGQAEDLGAMWDHVDDSGAPLDAEGKPLRGSALVKHILEAAKIVFARARPPIADVRELECSVADVQAAMNAIMTFSRLTKQAEPGES